MQLSLAVVVDINFNLNNRIYTKRLKLRIDLFHNRHPQTFCLTPAWTTELLGASYKTNDDYFYWIQNQ